VSISVVGLLAVSLLLIIPSSPGGPTLLKRYMPPFSGGLATASINSIAIGCGTAASFVLPYLNGTTAVGGFDVSASAWACSTTYPTAQYNGTNISGKWSPFWRPATP
jgi:hypothetical protein